MLRKILLTLAVVVTIVAHAQSGVGNWRVHPFYVGEDVKTLIDTDRCLYYLVGNDLFCLDKETEENESYNTGNYLNDVSVERICYNYDKKYLVVAYKNSNIDVIDQNGRVTNLPDIKNASLSGSRGINDITFVDGKMLVATEFGYVVFDDTRMEVIESRIYDVSVSSVAMMGDWLVALVDGVMRYAPANGHNENISSFDVLGTDLPKFKNGQLIPVSSHSLLVNADNSFRGYALQQAGDSKPVLATLFNEVKARAAMVQPSPEGFIASFVNGDSCYYTLDHDGTNLARVSAAPELYSCYPSGDGTLWALEARGVHRAGDAQNFFKPDGIGIKVGAYYMTFNQEQNKLILSSSSDNLIADWGSSLGAKTQIFAYDGFHWSDITPADLPGDGVSSNWEIVLDPRDARTYVYPSRKYGVVKVTDGKVVNIYDASNSNFGGSSWYKGACAFDSDGNLWVVYSSNAASTEDANNVAVLPRAKYEQDACSKSDWIIVNVPGTKQQFFKHSSFVVVNGVKVYNSSGYQKAFSFWTEDKLGDRPKTANYATLMDQDGKSVSWNYVYCMVADHNGLVWAGLNNGIICFDPAQALSSDFTINHIKVPRNDGTGLADYLLDGSQVNCIAVDGANRKWIGTNSSGLFLVSADGSQILQQFTTDNSYLSTNTIYGVCCNPNSNSVYVLTPSGFLEYFSDTTPGASSYSNVYVYPNPVRPDFMGMIVINGLMDNSLVKIADASGQVIKQLRSTGGMATWDCCNDSGERVSTGVYYVLASENEGGSASAAVAKFLVVK